MENYQRFWANQNNFSKEVINKVFRGIEDVQDYLYNGNGSWGMHHNDIRFNFGTRIRKQGYKKGFIYTLGSKGIRKSGPSKNVLGYTKIPSIDLFGDRLGGLEIFFLAPGEETGYLHAGEVKKIDDTHPNYHPVERNVGVEVLFPLGSWKIGEDYSKTFLPANSLRQYTEDQEELFFGYTEIGLKDYKFREENNQDGKKKPEIIITRGYLPSGQRFGEKSTIVNPNNLKAYQLFGLMGINAQNPKNRNLMAMISGLGQIPFTDRSYSYINGSNKKL